MCCCYFFFNAAATSEIYTLSLHDALPIFNYLALSLLWMACAVLSAQGIGWCIPLDRKSTRLNSSHVSISYAVFCLKKKKNTESASLNPVLIICRTVRLSKSVIPQCVSLCC